MASWEKAIIDCDLGEWVRREYGNLLCVGKSGEEAEALLVDYFSSHPNDELTIGRFWMILALCEWKLGRLTPNADENARQWANYPWNSISKTALDSLVRTLDTPMPSRKKVRIPSYISHCPWPVGTLLAYRIISSDHPHVTNSVFYGKYVLLRVIQIKKIPVSKLAPDDAWGERMLVGLYNWIGDSIPSPKIVDNLQFTAVSEQNPMLPISAFRNTPMIQNAADTTQLHQLLVRTTQPRIETCCDLDWKCVKGIKTTDVFTRLGCDPSFEQKVLPFFQTGISDYAMCHSIPFDAVLVNRFTQLAEKTNI